MLDLDQLKTLRGFSDLLILFFFFFGICFWFSETGVLSFLVLTLFLSMFCIITGETVALILIRAVLLILNFNINIKNKLIYSCCVDHDFINVYSSRLALGAVL